MERRRGTVHVLKRIVLSMLCFGVILVELRLPVRAEESTYEDSNISRKENWIFDPDEIEYEIKEDRRGYEKHFHMRDGRNVAVTYRDAVFYREGEEYKEIDNRISKTEEGFENSNNKNWRVKFGTTENGKHLEIKDGIRIGIKGAKTGLKGEMLKTEKYDDSPFYSKSVSEVIRYEEILPEVNADYQLFGQYGIKENIILKSEAAGNTIEYEIETEKYEIAVSDNRVSFIREGKEEYYFEAPYAYDDNYVCTNLITLSYSGGTLRLEVDEGWLSDEERAYPVIIDPVITKYQRRSSVSSTTAYSKSPNSHSMYSYGAMVVGREASSYLNCRGAFKFELPQLDESDMIIGASIWLSNLKYRGTGNNVVKVAQITSNIPMSTLTWNNLDGNFGDIREFAITSAATVGEWFEFDITGIVRDWYLNDNNYGLALISSAENLAYRYATFVTTHNGSYESRWPYATVAYISKDGLEEYLSYETMGSLTLGNFHIGVFNGNLIYQQSDTEMSGNWLPVSISHIYNHHQRSNGETVSANMKYGNGFRLNISLKISYDSDNDWYIYTDEDGTDHYYLNENGSYKEEFNTDNVLQISANNYTLDYDSWKIVFNKTTGLVSYIEDKIANKRQNYTYNSNNQLTKVTDGGGRETTFTYNTNKYLTKITYAGGRQISFTYNSNGQLTGITKPDGNTISYSYTSEGELQSVSNSNEGRIDLEYLSANLKRVSKLKRFGKQNGAGETVTFTYRQCETEVSDTFGYGRTYLFDEEGHTVCVRDSEGKAVYGAYGNSNDNNKHSLSYESEMQSTAINLLKNHAPLNNSSYTGTFTVVDTNDNDAFYSGKAFKIINTNSISQSVTVTAGKEYTASAYVKVTNGSSYKVRINTGEALGETGKWQRIRYTFTPTGSTYTFTITGQGTGEALVKNFQVEEGSLATRYNLLENAHFLDNMNNWSINYTSSVDGLVTGRSGNGYQITSTASQARSVSQDVSISGNANDRFIISLWAKNNVTTQKELNASSANTGNNQGRKIGVRVSFIKSDNTIVEGGVYLLESASTSWQYLSESVSAPVNYKGVKVNLISEHCYGPTVFDDIQLYVENFGTTYTYDNKGRITSSKDRLGNIITTAYKTITITTTDGSETTDVVDYVDYTRESDSSYHKKSVYSYNNKGNISAETYTDYNLPTTDPNRTVTVNYTYDSEGNLKSSSVNGQLNYQSSQAGYSSNYLTSYTDERGKTSTFNYDSATGHLLTATDALSRTTSYSYLSNRDLISSITSGSSTVNYTYNNIGQTTGITHTTSGTNTNGYTFSYDQFGNLYNIKVGNRLIAEYVYGNNNGLMNSVLYGTGEAISYDYDSLKRVTGFRQGGSLIYSYSYGTDGKLGKVTDHARSRYAYYEYNLNGDITAEVRNDGTRIFREYDDSGKSTSFGFKDGTNTYKTTYSYDPAEEVESISWNSAGINATLTYGRDYLKRTTQSNYKISNASKLITDVNYLQVTTNNVTKTTNVIESVENTFGTNHFNYAYEYDDVGNITKITVSYDNSTYIYTYQYDTLNQLIRENDPLRNRTVTYSYDNGGNILTKKVYSYTTGTLPASASSTVTYTYEDTDWKDLLTKYNGNFITYDNIGEPVIYYDNKRFEWNFRRLDRIIDSSNTYLYKYNSDGIRTTKTVNGTTTEYTVSGTKILKETSPSKILSYEYDDNGDLRSFIYNGTKYIYVRNGTNDIIGILNSSGTLVARYNYDGYGNCSVTNIGGNTIGNINPFRYRSYYYDSESGFYYLNSRFYDPVVGRFISADGLEYLGAKQTVLSYNLFTYCNNNPVNAMDKDGNLWFEVAMGGVNVVISLIFTVCTGQRYTILDALVDFASATLAGFRKYEKYKDIFLSVGSFIKSYVSEGKNVVKALKNTVITFIASKLSMNRMIEKAMKNDPRFLKAMATTVFDIYVTAIETVGTILSSGLFGLSKIRRQINKIRLKLQDVKRKVKGYAY